jgi:hypothetical protein
MCIAEKIDDYQNYGLGWKFYCVEKIFVEVTQFQPPTGASHIKLPKNLAIKKKVVNPANDNDKCFQWAVLVALHEVKDYSERVVHYKKYEGELNFKNISFLIQADEIILRRFERQNPTIALCICEWCDH